MSVRMALYLVDWDEFQNQALEGDELELTRKAQEQMLIDESEFWSWEMSDHVEEVKLSTDSSHAPLAFLEEFDRFGRAWKEDGKVHFKEVFHTLFWPWRGNSGQAMELKEGEEIDLFGIDTALDPETAADLLRSADQITWEQCRPLFKAGSDRFPTFDDWRAYGEEWLAFLRRAAEERRGLIVAMFG
jgi:hypothetical protein